MEVKFGTGVEVCITSDEFEEQDPRSKVKVPRLKNVIFWSFRLVDVCTFCHDIPAINI